MVGEVVVSSVREANKWSASKLRREVEAEALEVVQNLLNPFSGSQGDEVFLLEGREIVLGDSILTLSNGPKTKSQAYTNRMYRSPSLNGAYQSSGGGPYQRRESRALAVFQLKGKKHVQEIADLFNR